MKNCYNTLFWFCQQNEYNNDWLNMLLYGFLGGSVVKNPPASTGDTQFSSVAQLCPILCDPMNRSTPGLPVHHQLPESTQTHVHWVSDAIQPSHPLSPPSPPALNLSQHQGLFQWKALRIRWPKYWSFGFNDTGDLNSIPGSGRYPAVGNGNLLQCSCRENWMDRGAWQTAVHEITESDAPEHSRADVVLAKCLA